MKKTCVQCKKPVRSFAQGGLYGVGWCNACCELNERKMIAYLRARDLMGNPSDFPETYNRAFAQGGIPKELEVH